MGRRAGTSTSPSTPGAAPATYELSSQALSEIVDGGLYQHLLLPPSRFSISGAASAATEGASVHQSLAGGEATVDVPRR